MQIRSFTCYASHVQQEDPKISITYQAIRFSWSGWNEEPTTLNVHTSVFNVANQLANKGVKCVHLTGEWIELLLHTASAFNACHCDKDIKVIETDIKWLFAQYQDN